ncbi:MAG: YggS family pyridoxal phosphate-dependent enzyme, partial [Verrucomicrobiota bacterium]
MPSEFSEKLALIHQKMEESLNKCGRPEEDVVLLPATKKQSAEKIQEAIECGIKRFGENRIQEAREKIPVLPTSIRWDFIGGLQRNKVKEAVYSFDLIHSVESLKLAQEIDKRAEQLGVAQKILI